MNLFTDPTRGLATRPLRDDAVRAMLEKDKNGNIRFQYNSMNVAYLVVDTDLSDDAILHSLTTCTEKSALPFTTYVIAGRHSTHAAMELLKSGGLTPAQSKRACLVWRLSTVEREGALILGAGENRARQIANSWEPTFLDQASFVQALLSLAREKSGNDVFRFLILYMHSCVSRGTKVVLTGLNL
jgi:hypothetical protein